MTCHSESGSSTVAINLVPVANLLLDKHGVVEELLQLLVRGVDAQLLEAVFLVT